MAKKQTIKPPGKPAAKPAQPASSILEAKRKRSVEVKRSSSGSVAWITVGSVAAVTIGAAIWMAPTAEPMIRDKYASQEDCQADWGGDAGICDQTGADSLSEKTERTSTSTSSGFHSSSRSSYWYGPMYNSGDRDGAIRSAWSGKADSNFVPGNRSIGRTSVSRGGFGSSSRSFSSSSSSSGG